ncbi:MAG: hypothetical protein JWL70_2034 [Acidimicrobiia bacterium]|nr:hypothetical protein [Acidimicrobiia bacterium]
MKWQRQALVGLMAAAIVTLAPWATAAAHPLGNLTVNTSVELRLSPEAINADVVLDLAELPTVQARQAMDTNNDNAVSDSEAAQYRTQECRSLADGLHTTVDQQAVKWAVGDSALAFPVGQGGLVTLRLTCSLGGPQPSGTTTHVVLNDSNLNDRIGWREIVAVGDGMTLSSSTVPTTSSSMRLTQYPKLSSSPPRQLQATVVATIGGPRLAAGAGAVPSAGTHPQARGADGLTQRFNSIIGKRHLSLPLGLLALAVAMLLGAIHSLAPGHGKTLMAATVVSRSGTNAQILGIGGTVAVTHTAGVLALGTMIWTSQSIAPDRLLPWLTVASGALLLAAGLGLLIRRLVTGQPLHHHHFGPVGTHDHPHPHSHEAAHDHASHDHASHDHPPHAHAPHDHAPHDHGHHDHDHDHGDPKLEGTGPASPSNRWVVLMGIAGGLVPTPSALLVLLGAAALGRTWFGVVLVGAYGVGMAATLVAAGVILVRLQGWLEDHWYGSPWLRTTMRYAPIVTAGLLMAGGLSVALRGATQLT